MELAVATFYKPPNDVGRPVVVFQLEEFMTAAGDMLEVEILNVKVIDRAFGHYNILGKLPFIDLWVKADYSIHRHGGTIELARRPR
jgi:hypothetical protein